MSPALQVALAWTVDCTHSKAITKRSGSKRLVPYGAAVTESFRPAAAFDLILPQLRALELAAIFAQDEYQDWSFAP